jgi:hypothetical protein
MAEKAIISSLNFQNFLSTDRLSAVKHSVEWVKFRILLAFDGSLGYDKENRTGDFYGKDHQFYH